ncbi:16S rRNA (guanine(527)-N(7))-methyltransferase RsmG [bacterium]|nr:16S rRNA (guanine(527)-N(7))-methyltransferase RsmG [bacterium]
MIKYDILKQELNLEINENLQNKLNLWEKLFIEYNNHTNLMSKNDVEVLFEKHVFDSLAILKWQNFTKIHSLLDVGCGGGFPSLMLAICFPDKKIIANDSRIKKINFIKLIKQELNLQNLEILYSRIEDAQNQNIDLITSRAVGEISKIWELSNQHLKNKGYFLIYKSNFEKELKDFQKKYKLNPEIISYTLPLEENFKRNLIIFQK